MDIVSLLTYNIDSNQHDYEQRMTRFLELVSQLLPDLLTIQEGHRLTFDVISRKLSELGYRRFLPEQVRFRKVGEAIFSKHPIVDTKFTPFQKATDGKGLTMAKIEVEKKLIWLITSQFDESVTLKRQQIEALQIFTRDFKEPTIFAGDTRITSYQTNIREPEGWYDIWYESGTSTNEFTYDSKLNMLAVAPCRDRPDRIWVRSGTISTSFDLIGAEKAIGSHFGVSTCLSI